MARRSLYRPLIMTLPALAVAGTCALVRGDDGQPGIAGRLLGEEGGLELRRLGLVKETKLEELLPGERFEASGVDVHDGDFYVVFDDRTDMARIEGDLSLGRWVKTNGEGPGYEGLAWASAEKRFYAVVEAKKHKHRIEGRVAAYDEQLELVDEAWLEGISLPTENKGYEGIAWAQRDERSHLFALHEGDPDDADDDGSIRGRIDVYRQTKDKDGWKLRGTLKLPKAVDLEDYSAIDVQGDRVVVASQTSSRLWVGTLEKDAWQWKDNGTLYAFPGEEDGKPLYRSIEGVAWFDAGRVVCVSDLLKEGNRGRDKDQSIHIFALAAGGQ